MRERWCCVLINEELRWRYRCPSSGSHASQVVKNVVHRHAQAAQARRDRDSLPIVHSGRVRSRLNGCQTFR